MAKMLKIASKGDGLPLVFIHGWGVNSGIWQPCVDQLASQYQVITVDIPGFGLNVDAKISPYTLEGIADAIHQTVQTPAVFIGWSLGGLIATEITRQFPESVIGLIKVASTPSFVEQEAEQETWPGIVPSVLSLFHRQLEQDTRKTIDNFLKIQAMGSPHIRQDIKLIRDLVMQFPMPSKETLDKSLQFLEQIDHRQILPSIQVPCLRIYGRLDGLVPKKVIPLIDELMPESDKVIFEQASHAPFISDLDDFVQAITQWLERRL